VAPLILESARSVREEARRLRAATLGLRLAVRRNIRIAGASRKMAAEASAARREEKRALRSRSPWSGLEWHRDDEQLERVLVPLD
jgi:hypothetical protein